MKKSEQDSYYLEKEGDSFFERNYGGKALPELRTGKKVILDNILKSKIEFNTVLEYGCCYADLLDVLKNTYNKDVYGVEASAKAVEFSKEKYKSQFSISHGTVAENEINADRKFNQHFDLVIIDDVFGWISRETLFHSIANIDAAIKEGGYLYIRDFYPDRRVKNRNHHVNDAEVYNYKVPGSHASLFLASGTYEVTWQEIYYDAIGMSTDYKCDNAFNYRWTDLILQKNSRGYFNESKKTP